MKALSDIINELDSRSDSLPVELQWLGSLMRSRHLVDGDITLPQFFTGLQAYSAHPYQRTHADIPLIWENGSTRLFDYGDASASLPPVLFIPSLINRSYILDLNKERSLLRYLADGTAHPYLIDWGEPVQEELHFSLQHYVERVVAIIDRLYHQRQQPITLVGYCMGGLLALAAALHVPEKTNAVGFLATPWDFHSAPLMYPPLTPEAVDILGAIISKMERLPKSLIQAFFYSINPQLIHDKFSAFSSLDPSSRKAQEFVEVERWVSDGISITSPVAKECLIDWGYHNVTLHNKWFVDGKCIDPSALQRPAFIAVAEQDHIVPPACAMPLSALMPDATLVSIPSGHVGMIIGGAAKQYLWQSLADWLRCTTK